jgi:hypothetical protein
MLSQIGNRGDLRFDSGIARIDVNAQGRDSLARGDFVH